MYPDWSKWDKKDLALYVNADAINFLGKLPENPFDMSEDPDGRRRVIELIYNQLLASSVSYALEKFSYADDVQKIRTPAEILSGAGRGTCLDLSLLFAGMAEGYDLVPVVTITEGHAFIIVSLKNGRREWDSFGRSELGALTEPVEDIAVVRQLVESGNYLAIECTGFAASTKLRDNPDDAYPETLGRDDRGLMPFEQALVSGKAQLFDRPEELGFALDITVAHRHKEPIEIGDATSIVSQREPADEVSADTKHGKASVAVAGETDVRLDTESEHGVTVHAVAEQDIAATLELPTPVTPSVKPLKGLVGRSRELGILKSAIEEAETIGTFGGPGWGKTALLRSIAYSDLDEMPDGVVYLKARAQPLEDVLQDLHDSFYRADEPAKPSPSTIKQRLKDKEAVVILDDVGLDADSVEDLVNALPKSTFVLAAATPSPFGEARPVRIEGLGADEALSFFEKRLGEPIPEEDKDAAREICKALDGHPGHLIEAANAVLGGQLLVEVARTYQGTAEPSAVVAETVRGDLTPIQQKVAEILDAARVPVSLPLLERVLADDMADLPDGLQPAVRALIASERVEAHSPRYSLAGTVAEGTLKHWDATDWMGSLLSNLAGWSESPEVSNDEINRDRQFILRALEWGTEAEQWTEVVRVAKAVDRGIALGRHWGAWQQVLEHALTAAEELGDESTKAWALHQMGARAIGLGADAAGLAYLTQALDLRVRLGENEAANVTRHNLKFVKVAPPKIPGRRPVGLGPAVIAGIVGAFLLAATAYASPGGWSDRLRFEPSALSFRNIEVGEIDSRVLLLVNQSKHDIRGIKLGVDSAEFEIEGGSGQDRDEPESASPLGGDAPLAADAIDSVGSCLLDSEDTIDVLASKTSCSLRVMYRPIEVTPAGATLSATVTDPDGTITAPLRVALPEATADTLSDTTTPGNGTRPANEPDDTDSPTATTTTDTTGTDTTRTTTGTPPPTPPDGSDGGDLAIEISSRAGREVTPGGTFSSTITITNAGSTVDAAVTVTPGPFLTVQSMTSPQGRPCQSELECVLGPFEAPQNLEIELLVSEDAAGSVSLTATVAWNDGDERSHTVEFDVVAVPIAAAVVDPPQLDFSDVEVGQASTRELTFSNGGNGQLTIADLDTGGTLFTAAGCVGEPLDPGASCSITVTFRPWAEGTATTTLTIAHDGADSPTPVELSGNGTEPDTTEDLPGTPFIEIAGELLSFTPANAVQRVSVTNAGTAPVEITGIGPLTHYQAAGCVGNPLGPNESCVLTLTFDGTGDWCEVLELEYAGEGDRRILLKGSS